MPVEQPISFTVGSGMRVCTSTACAFLGAGDERFEFPPGNYTGFDLQATVAQDLGSEALAEHRPVDFAVTCYPAGKGGCGGWRHMEAGGPLPVRLNATGLEVRPDDRLVLTVRYVGPDAGTTHGSGLRYDVVGTLMALAEAGTAQDSRGTH